jgi:hypothetical protein
MTDPRRERSRIPRLIPLEMTEEAVMAAKPKVTVSMQPTNHRPTTAERRAAQIAALSTRQAEIKQEAADRREERATKSAADGGS